MSRFVKLAIFFLCFTLISLVAFGQWVADYIDDTQGLSMQRTSDGGYIVAGGTCAGVGGSMFERHDFWVLKLDPSGIVVWQKAYGGDKNDIAHSIQQTSDDGYIVTGITLSFGSGKSDIWILKLDGGGNVEWQKTFGGSNGESSWQIVQTEDGGYIVTGKAKSFGAGSSDIWVLKLDSTGNILWQRTGVHPSSWTRWSRN